MKRFTTLIATLLILFFLQIQNSFAHTSTPTAPAQSSGDAKPNLEMESKKPLSENDASGQAPTSNKTTGDMSEHAGHDMSGHEGQSDNGSQDGEGMTMNHPGMPLPWVFAVVILMCGIIGWTVGAPVPVQKESGSLDLSKLPYVGALVRVLNSSPVPLFFFKVLAVIAFILVVVAGFFGTVYPERNLATVIVWNWWWPLVVISVFFVGSAWCAICPWDNLASWVVRRRFWKRINPHPGLNRKVPKYLRNVWAAMILFMGLTWLELGIGITSMPKATAITALLMLGLSFIFLILFERKAFCRYACPVGRTLGFYARLAPIAIHPKDQDICTNCKTMECYHGSKNVEPCPTSLTVGKFSQNTYCLSCGNCVLSCPYENVSWRLRTMGSEAMTEAMTNWDGAWFMLALMGITTFHGVTMLPAWTELVMAIATTIGETGLLIWSFTIGMLAGFAAPVVLYAVAIKMTVRVTKSTIKFKRLFAALPFATLPLAFTYHLAHNLNHLFREGGGVFALFLNPFGTGLEPTSMMERHEQMANSIPVEVVATLQGGLMLLGVWLAVHILRHRAKGVLPGNDSITGMQLIPMLVFIFLITGFNVWLLSLDMVMRF